MIGVSNPGRNVWDADGDRYVGTVFMFQIPEGTFGTQASPAPALLLGNVSNPGRNVWDSLSKSSACLLALRFKSRKERLGPQAKHSQDHRQDKFQIPEGTFGTGGDLDAGFPIDRFQIPEGTFGTNLTQMR